MEDPDELGACQESDKFQVLRPFGPVQCNDNQGNALHLEHVKKMRKKLQSREGIDLIELIPRSKRMQRTPGSGIPSWLLVQLQDF